MIKRALNEDAVQDDVTTRWTVPAEVECSARIVAKGAGVVAGIPAVREVYAQIDSEILVVAAKREGQGVDEGEAIAEIVGPARGILSGERVAMNLLQRMSGIATAAAAYTEAVKGFPVRILDTRKTAPGMRALDKYAVATGGARNHRQNLSAMALVKENHIAAAGCLRAALDRVREGARAERRRISIEVEVRTVEQAREAMLAAATSLMLDNMSPDELDAVVQLRRDLRLEDTVMLEASGNVTLDSVGVVAASGVDFISVGALTHSTQALDLSLLVAGAHGSTDAS